MAYEAPADRERPYLCKMHWDPERQGVWIGFGVDLAPACGQPEFIGVTGYTDMVDCQKCRDIIERS